MQGQMRKAESAFVGALGFDCITVITEARAKALAAWGMKFGTRYLGTLTSKEVDIILAAGMSVFPVTYGIKHGTPLNGALGKTYGQGSVKNANNAGIVKGTTVFLDLEDCHGSIDDIKAFVNAWSYEVKAAEFIAGLYVGFGALLSSAELYSLASTRYWQSLSKETDSRGQLAEPNCGWCKIQLYPTVVVAGTEVDVNVVQKDYKGRLPTWTTAA